LNTDSDVADVTCCSGLCNWECGETMYNCDCTWSGHPPPGGDVHPSWVITLHCDYVNTWKKLGEMLSIKGSKFLFHIQVVTAGGREGLMSRGEMVYRVHTNPGSTPNCTGGPWYMATAADTW